MRILFMFILSCSVLLFYSCQKNSITVQHWQVQRGQDTAKWSAAFFCTRSDLKSIDTVSEYYTIQPDSSYYLGGRLTVNSRVKYNDSLYIRNYILYLKQLD